QTLAFLSIGPGVERTNRFARSPHGRIIQRDHHLGQHRHHRHLQTRKPKFRIKRLLQDVAYFALRGGVTDIERLSRNLARSPFRTQECRSHLRPVAVSENDAVAVTDQPGDLCRRASRVRQLLGDGALLAGANQRVPSYRQQHGFHGCSRHACTNSGMIAGRTGPTTTSFINSSMIAFWMCSRFSACWKTTERGESITSLVTSSPRCAGRQCMKMASRLAQAKSSEFT